MCRLYSQRTNRLLAQVKPAGLSLDRESSFLIVEGYRNIRRSWKYGTTFILEKRTGKSVISIDNLPAEKPYVFHFTTIG